MFITVLEVIGSSVLAYNLLPLLAVLYRKCTTRAVDVVRAKQEDPTDPYSPWLKYKDPNNENRMEPPEEHRLAQSCSTVTELFSKVVDKYSDKQCFGYRPVFDVKEEPQPNGRPLRKLALGDYQWQTYRQVFRSVRATHLGLTRVGVKTGDVVMVYADTRLEWMVACQALFRMGATVGTLYTNLGEEAIIHAINETEVTHMITNTELLPKISKMLDKLPHIQVIICITDGHQKDPNLNQTLDDSHRQRVTVYTFNEVQAKGEPALDSPEDKPVDQCPEDTAVLMYTSGSTGVPKGVLICHKNLLLTIKAFYEVAGVLNPETDTYSAFLPLAHILEICAELCFISIGVPVGYASAHTLTDKSLGLQKGVRGDLTTLRPTVILAVPLILDRIRKAIIDELSGSKRRRFVKRSIDVLLKYKGFWVRHGFSTPIIDNVVCRKFRALLGGRIRFIASGGAFLRPQTMDFIRNLFNVYVIQGYGLTETAASATITDFDDLSVGHVGGPMAGVKIKLVDWVEGGYRPADVPNPRGEIVIGGDGVTNGYYKRPELTVEDFEVDSKGQKWFHTGDVGEVMPTGVIKIIDRKKDIIKLSNGEYVSLSKIEEELKQNPLVDNICVYGNHNHKFLIALIVPNLKALQKLIENGHGGDALQKGLKDYCRDPSATAKVYQKVCTGTKLKRVELPAKIKLCHEEWTPDNGLVTSSFKLKRKAIEEYYRKYIKQMYGSEANNNPK